MDTRWHASFSRQRFVTILGRCCVKTLNQMIVAFTKSGTQAVSFVPTADGVRLTAVKASYEIETMMPKVELKSLAAQICANSFGLYMSGWNAHVEFVDHEVSQIRFHRLDRLAARRGRLPANKVQLAINF
ncbi:MAG: hypothetical protein WC766_03220 [Patescibacteria group bacterium]|jgi:hypothetical protein